MPAAESGPRYSLKQGLDKFDNVNTERALLLACR